MYRKYFIFTLLGVFGVMQGMAQVYKGCGATQAELKLRAKFPELVLEMDRKAALLEEFTTKDGARHRGNIIIPVVFHVIHNNGPENISDAQIFDAVKRINDDFNEMNADRANTIPAFDTLVANCNFQFKLATKDPSGNCTNGIDRIVSHRTYLAGDDSKLNIWNPSRYLNIWVVNSIGQAAGAAAYAYKPATADILFYYDGIIALYDYVGGIGASNLSHQHTLSHEIGHYLNLDHTWGATNQPGVACGNDGVGDTPETKGHDNCNNLYDDFCEPGRVENVQNFMEYSYCSTMFTFGQKFRMESALNSTIAQRRFLWDPITFNYTGCLAPRPDCSPHADFKVNRNFTCVGNPVTLTSTSWGDTAITNNWSTSSGSLSSSSGNSVQVTSGSAGWLTVTLDASSNAGTSQKSKSNVIFVADNVSTNPVGLTERFANNANLSKWAMINYFDNHFRFSSNTSVGLMDNACIMYNGFDNRTFPANLTSSALQDYDDFISPAFDLSSLTVNSAYLSFWISSATRSSIGSAIDDSLEVYFSVNCGNTWNKFYTLKGTELHNKGSISSINYVPNTFSDWKAINLALPENALTANTFIRFRYKPGELSNNFYLDELSFGSLPTEVSNLSLDKSNDLILVPNPSKGSGQILAKLSKPNTICNLEIVDITGRIIILKTVKSDSQGYLTESYDLGNRVNAGMYIVRLKSENLFRSARLSVAN
jgi:hypothetical protein